MSGRRFHPSLPPRPHSNLFSEEKNVARCCLWKSMNTLNSPTMPTTDKAAATPSSSNIFFSPSKLRPGIRNLPDPGPDLWRKRGKEWEGRNEEEEEEEGGDLCKCCHRSSPPPPPPGFPEAPSPDPNPALVVIIMILLLLRSTEDGSNRKPSSPPLVSLSFGLARVFASHPSIHRRRKGKKYVVYCTHPPER